MDAFEELVNYSIYCELVESKKINYKENIRMEKLTKETNCTHCIHREICGKKDEYFKLLKLIEELNSDINEKDFAIVLYCNHVDYRPNKRESFK